MALKRNVLLFHTGALGDFVLSWPLALAFGRVFAQSRVFYVTHRQKGLLAEKALRIESADVDGGGWHALYGSEPATLPEPAARLLAGAHAIVGFNADTPGDAAWLSNVRSLAPQTEVVSLAAHPPAGYAKHHTEFLLEQVGWRMIWWQGVQQMLASIASRGLGLSPTAGGPVVIHPGAGSPSKCWPAEWYTELAVRLKSAGRDVRFVVGEVELEKWSDRQLDQLEAAGELRRSTTLTGLFEAMQGASAFVGNDSGPGHLAGVLGLPTVSLFGPTDPAVWKPLGPRVTVLRNEPISNLPVEKVVDAVLGL